mgnify:CR=1 FL=1
MSSDNKIGHKRQNKGLDYFFMTSDTCDGPRSIKGRRWCKRFTSKNHRIQDKKVIKEQIDENFDRVNIFTDDLEEKYD